MAYILGGWQSDFSRNWAREGLEIGDGFAETLAHGLESAGLQPADIDVGHVGNFVGDLFAGQGMLGGFFAMADPAFDGMPASRHEAACASGGMAILAAMADIEAGRYGTAAVLGIELMRNVPGQVAAEYLGAAAWAGHEYQDATYAWPRAFSDLTEEYDRRFGIDEAHLRRIAEINFGNARRNPNAQTRNFEFEVAAAVTANVTVGGSYTNLDAEFTSNAVSGPRTLPYNGNALPRSPESQFTLYADGEWDAWGGQLATRIDYQWTDEYYFDPSNNPEVLVDPYGLLSAFVSWESHDGLKLSLYGRNLTDEDYRTHIIKNVGIGFSVFGAPRNFGVALTKTF